jgi:hypothetical protein
MLNNTISSSLPLCISFYYVCLHRYLNFIFLFGGRRGREHMVVGFTTTDAISAYHH